MKQAGVLLQMVPARMLVTECVILVEADGECEARRVCLSEGDVIHIMERLDLLKMQGLIDSWNVSEVSDCTIQQLIKWLPRGAA